MIKLTAKRYAKSLAAAIDDIGGEWRTINGQHIFIKDGESVRDAFTRRIAEDQKQTKEAYMTPNGHYMSGRLKLHDAAIHKYEHRPSQDKPVIQLLAGGAASGKTTAGRAELTALRNPAMVNVDDIKADLPESTKYRGSTNLGLLQEEASDIRDKVLLSALGHNNDIALDAVGSKDVASKLSNLEKAGYTAKIAYMHMPVEKSIELADRRARTSSNPSDRGRFIPHEVISASHEKARGALPYLMSNNRDIKIYDGSGDKPNLIYHREGGRVLVRDHDALERMRTSEKPEIPDIF